MLAGNGAHRQAHAVVVLPNKLELLHSTVRILSPSFQVLTTRKIGRSGREVGPNQAIKWGQIKVANSCPGCGHEWRARIESRWRGAGCPRCADRPRRREALAAERPDLVGEWFAERNGDLDPATITAGSPKRVWWRCRTCGHEWEAQVVSRAASRGRRGCPACARRQRKLRGTIAQDAPARRQLGQAAQRTRGLYGDGHVRVEPHVLVGVSSRARLAGTRRRPGVGRRMPHARRSLHRPAH